MDVARKYKTDLQALAEVNNIEDVHAVKEGTNIYIPGATPKGFERLIESKRSPIEKRKKKIRGPEKHPSQVYVEHDRFQWPICGDLSSLFGMRHGRRHDGIDIRSPQGTPITAAADGEVVYAKRMRGYGNLVLLKHEGDLFTVYAHNSVNLTKQGTKVKQGEVIAKVGRTGRATGPHLHFEVREGTAARNPLFFLPKNKYSEKFVEKGESYGGPQGEVEVKNP